MFKILKNGENLTFISSEGQVLTKNFSDNSSLINYILIETDEEKIKSLFLHKFKEKIEEFNNYKYLIENISKSNILSLEGVIITIPSISKMSVPQNLALKIIEAEEKCDTELLKSYLNFWKLCTLNPSEVTRQNLFWFLDKNGFIITKSGLFVAYRNVVLKDGKLFDLKFCKAITENYLKIKNWKKSPSNYNLWFNVINKTYEIHLSHIELDDKISTDYYYEDENGEECIEEEYYNVYELKGNVKDLYESLSEQGSKESLIFTDSYSRSTTIKIGKPVSIPRNSCDDDNEVTCSNGLHVASKHWLEQNYFGDIGLICLVNPKNVVAVPFKEDYGKMRVCEYLPIGFSERDENNNLTDSIENCFDDGYEDYINYEGEEGKDSNFKIKVVEKVEYTKNSINSILEDFKDFILKTE